MAHDAQACPTHRATRGAAGGGRESPHFSVAGVEGGEDVGDETQLQ